MKEEIKNNIVKLREQGKSYCTIAKVLGVLKNTARRHGKSVDKQTLEKIFKKIEDEILRMEKQITVLKKLLKRLKEIM